MEENLQQGHDQRQRRLRTVDNVVSHPPEQPQRCPRCDSVNTKFCYYNNYSLTQPRYFCKTCRRYWTQGGTLRNVPVGGGCRKGGKRSKPSSSGGENSRSQPSPPLPPSRQPPLQLNPNLPTGNLALRNTEIGDLGLNPTITTTNSLFADGGFLSNSFGSFHQALNLGSQFAGTPSNLSLLHGFNVHNLRPQSIQSQNEIQQMGHREKITEPFYPSDQTIIHHQNRPTSSWTQTFINSTTTPTAVASSSSFWNNTSNAAGPSVGPTNQWPDLTGFGPPP